jgi:hypothetical protein
MRNGRYRDAEGKFLDALHPVFDPAVQVCVCVCVCVWVWVCLGGSFVSV